MDTRTTAVTLDREEAAVRARSAELHRELSIRDLAFSHVIFWLIAIVLFYLPSAAVAVWLNRAMPLEGGLYQWAKLGVNEFFGFMVAWNLWLFAILNMTNIGLQFTQYLGYILGARVAVVMAQNWVIALTMAMVVVALMWITTAGLQVGKWVHAAGGVLMLKIFGNR